MRFTATLLAGAGAALLASCGTPQQASRWLVAPGKYDIYTCPQIAEQMQKTEAEGRKLEGLMARADKDSSGRFVSNIAYEPDYLSNRGDMRELQKSAAAKNCPPPAPQPATAPSDEVVR